MRAIVGVELKGVRSGVERRSSRCVGIVSEWWWAERNARRARKSWRAPRRRGRTGTGVRIERASLGPASGASGFGRLRSSPRSNPTSSRSPPAPLASPPCSATARASNPGPPPTPSPSTRPVVRKLCSSSSVPRSNPSACAYRRSTVFIKNGLGCVGGGRYTGAAPAGGGCPGWIAPCARASSSARIAARNRRVRASACSASRNVPRTASLSVCRRSSSLHSCVSMSFRARDARRTSRSSSRRSFWPGASGCSRRRATPSRSFESSRCSTMIFSS